LLESLDTTGDAGAEAAWEKEIARRLKELDSPQPHLVSWSDARRQILGL
jgi:hypothetical protein